MTGHDVLQIKTAQDQERYEELFPGAGFSLIHRAKVRLSGDRVASGRSLHHGRETGLMQRDILFTLRPLK